MVRRLTVLLTALLALGLLVGCSGTAPTVARGDGPAVTEDSHPSVEPMEGAGEDEEAPDSAQDSATFIEKFVYIPTVSRWR